MADSDEAAVAAVAGEIKRYLEAHPNVADSVERITRWCYYDSGFEEATGIVQRALDELVAEGKAVKTVMGKGEIVYSCI